MKTIWKYTLTKEVTTITIPDGAQLLHVGEQFNQGQLWFIVDTDQPLFERTFEIVGTGQELPQNSMYCGTYQTLGGSYVWHVFEIKPVPEGHK